MKKIYQNFDGLDISFQCALPENILETLANAKLEAQESKKPIFVELGKNKVRMAVAATGSVGYAYRLDSGLDGATWFINHSIKANDWNVRVSCKSLFLALNGYYVVKETILKILEDLGAYRTVEIDDKLTKEKPKERISRFDYCIDFATDNFIPDLNCFVIHGRSKKNFYGKGDVIDFSGYEQGKTMESVTIGKMPNRQIILYNKTREIISSQKDYWWKIWGLNEEEFKGAIWRVEIRAGKKELNKWQLKKFRDFENKAGDVIISILKAAPYKIQNKSDKNRSRWSNAEFWDICIKSTKEYLAEYICNADKTDVITDYRNNISKRLRKQISGSVITCTAALGMDISEIPGVFDLIQNDLLEELRKNPQNIIKKYKNAEKRFVFLDK